MKPLLLLCLVLTGCATCQRHPYLCTAVAAGVAAIGIESLIPQHKQVSNCYISPHGDVLIPSNSMVCP